MKSHLPANKHQLYILFSSIIVFLSVPASIKGSPCQDKHKAVLFEIFNSKFMLHGFLSPFFFFALFITVIPGTGCKVKRLWRFVLLIPISPIDHLLRRLFSHNFNLSIFTARILLLFIPNMIHSLS